MIQIIGTYEWSRATSIFDAKTYDTLANKWNLFKKYLLEKLLLTSVLPHW